MREGAAVIDNGTIDSGRETGVVADMRGAPV